MSHGTALSPWRRYGVALTSFTLAYAVTRLLWPIKEGGVFILFLAAVKPSAGREVVVRRRYD